MLEIIRRHPLAFTLAVIMHLAIIMLMIFGLDWLNPPEPQKPTGRIVQAQLVDTQELARLEAKKKQRELEQKQKAEAQRREIERKKQAELKRQQEKKKAAEKKRREEKQRKAEAEKKRKLALQKKQQEKQKKLELERKRKIEEKKRKEKARKAAEAKKKAELAKKKEAERKKALAEKKRKAEEAKRKVEQKAREAELEAQWAAEKDARERDRITAAIKRKVQNSWLRPPATATGNLEATVRVRLNEKGSVLLAQVVKSSGNGAFDRSVVAAVNKADPLPMPTSPRLLAEFRDFTFIFRPTP